MKKVAAYFGAALFALSTLVGSAVGWVWTSGNGIGLDANVDLSDGQDTVYVWPGDEVQIDIYCIIADSTVVGADTTADSLDSYDIRVYTSHDSLDLLFSKVSEGPYLGSNGGTTIFQKDTIGSDNDTLSVSASITGAADAVRGDGLSIGKLFSIFYDVNTASADYTQDITIELVKFFGPAGTGDSLTITDTINCCVKWANEADIDRDGDVDTNDLALLRYLWHIDSTDAVLWNEKYDLCDDPNSGIVDWWDGERFFDLIPSISSSYGWDDDATCSRDSGWIMGDFTGTPLGYTDFDNSSAPDEYVDIYDLSAFCARWHENVSAAQDSIFDIVTSPAATDNFIDIYDMIAFCDNWHEGLGPVAAQAPSKGVITIELPLVKGTISAEMVNLTANEAVVNILASNRKGLRCYSVDVTYNSTMKLVSISEGDFLKDNTTGNTTCFLKDEERGRVNIAGSILGKGNARNENGIIATLTFKVNGNAKVDIENLVVFDDSSPATCAATYSGVSNTTDKTAIRVVRNAPNPFSARTEFVCNIPGVNHMRVEIYNAAGELVRTLKASDTRISWNGNDNTGRSVPSGIYFYKLSAGNYNTTQKLILIR